MSYPSLVLDDLGKAQTVTLTPFHLRRSVVWSTLYLAAYLETGVLSPSSRNLIASIALEIEPILAEL
jgi:hypothetical protein